MSDPSAVSCCPECWLSGKYSMIETSPNNGFVSCPTHGEMTISHFMSRFAEVEKDKIERCSCDNPIQGNYLCNGDAYQCDNCQGVVSGRQLRIHARKQAEK